MTRCGSPSLAGLACLLTVLAGCASLPAPPRVSRAWHETLPGLAKDTHPVDVLRAGDRIVVAVTDGSRTRERVTWIEGDGRGHVGPGQDVQLAGASLEQAQQRIGAVVRARDRLAYVDVRRYQEPAAHAVVLGAVNRPGRAGLVPAMRVSGLVATSGGLLQTVLGEGGRIVPSPSDLAGARLIREGKALPIDMERALLGEPGHDVLVHPGDILYVPYASTNAVAVLGQVGRPDVLPLRPRGRLTEMLAGAGGVTVDGDRDDIRVLRGRIDEPIAYSASLSSIVDGEGHDTVLLPGDVVFVTDHPFEDVSELSDLIAPLAGMASMFLITSLLLSQ